MLTNKTIYPLLTAESTFDAVILCNGDFPSHPIPLAILAHARYLCCCDGAALACLAHGLKPDAIVGDGDSLPQHMKQAYAAIFHPVSEQDDNDQTKATRFCLAQGYKRIAYVGSTGKREDHTLGNISLLSRYKHHMGLEVTMITDYGWFVAAQSDACFEAFPQQQVSIFNEDCTVLTSSQLKWNAYPCTALWQGTLNEALNNAFELTANGNYLVFRTFEAKG